MFEVCFRLEGGILPTDLGRTGAAIEMAIREARKNIVPNVYIHYDIISRKGMTTCADEENHALYLVTNYAYAKAGKQGIPPVGLLVGPACSGQFEHFTTSKLCSLVPLLLN